MKILILEPDYSGRKFMVSSMSAYGECDVTIDDMETVNVFMAALDKGEPYDLICLDVMKPATDGYRTLKVIRDIEKQHGIEDGDRVKIIMMIAINEQKNMRKVFEMGYTVYCVKPVDSDKLKNVLKKLKLFGNNVYSDKL